MNIKCSKCGNEIFDNNVYLKIQAMENKHQNKINEIKNKIEELKHTNGDEALRLCMALYVEEVVLNEIRKCKNLL